MYTSFIFSSLNLRLSPLFVALKTVMMFFYQREIRNLKGNHLFEPDLLPPGGPLGVTA